MSLSARILIAIGLVLIGAAAGWRVCAAFNDAAHAKELQSEIKLQQQLAINAHAVGLKLAQQTQGRADDARRQRDEINQWKAKGTINVQCPNSILFQAVPQSAVHFGADFIGEWDVGMCLGSVDPQACRRRVIDAAASGADAVTPGDIQQNVSDNAQACGDDRSRLKAWQDLARRNGWVPGEKGN